MPRTSPLSFRRDTYKTARGRSQFLDVSCARCGTYVALYQKDGPGPLKRMYLDRFFKPAHLAPLAAVKSAKKLPPFKCSKCGEDFGIPFVYAKENRLAYKLFQSVLKTAKHVKSQRRASSSRKAG